MSITTPDDRVTTYAPVVATTTFAADFPVFDNSDLAVIHNGVERTDFTVLATYVASISNDARVVFATGITGSVLVVGAREPRRSNRFGSGQINANMLNAAFDTAQGEMQEARRDIERAIKVGLGDPLQSLPEPDGVSLLGWSSDNKLVNRAGEGESAAAAEAAADRAVAAALAAGSSYIFPELMASWSPSDTGPAIEEATTLSAANGGSVKLTAGKTYPVTQLTFTAGSVISAVGALIEVAGTLTGSDVDVTLGNGVQFDEIVIQSPGTETNTDICSIGQGVRGEYLEVKATSQRAGGGIVINPQGVQIGYIKARKIDRPLHLWNASTVSQTTDCRIGFLDVEDYVRAFRATFTEFSLGGLWAVGRSTNASKSPGHNGVLIVGCANWDIGDCWIEDAGEHPVRIGGSEGIWARTANYKIGMIYTIRSGGCPLKINPTLKTTIAGTVAVTAGSPTVTGTGTAFLTELRKGENVRINDTLEVRRVLSIASNTSLTLTTNASTTDASSTLDVMEQATNGQIAGVVGIDAGDTTVVGNEELLRITHARGLKIGPCVAFRNNAAVSSQYLLQINDCDDVEISSLGGDSLNGGFCNFDGMSDIDAGQFGGDITNLRIGRVHGSCAGNDAFNINSTFNIGKVSIGLDNISGFAANLVRWTAGTLIDAFEMSGRVSGSIAPVYLTVPNSDLFLIDVAYNNSRTIGRASGSRPGTAILEIMGIAFSAANQAGNGLVINGTQSPSGNGNYGAGIEGTRLGSSRRGWAIVPRQGSADDKEVGVSIFTGDSAATANESLNEALRIGFDRGLFIPDGIAAPATMTGWAGLYVDAADGDLKVKFGDGTVKTIAVDT